MTQLITSLVDLVIGALLFSRSLHFVQQQLQIHDSIVIDIKQVRVPLFVRFTVCSIFSTMISKPPPKRGAFIVLEGVDRCGKTTQASLLVNYLIGIGLATIAMRFPDRTTLVGDLINQYLQSKSDLDDRAVHLLFSSNRWEAAPKLQETLTGGKNIVCDRYAHSGVAFSSAKPSLADHMDWCKACDVGLPAPDAVIFLDLSQEQAEQRGG